MYIIKWLASLYVHCNTFTFLFYLANVQNRSEALKSEGGASCARFSLSQGFLPGDSQQQRDSWRHFSTFVFQQKKRERDTEKKKSWKCERFASLFRAPSIHRLETSTPGAKRMHLLTWRRRVAISCLYGLQTPPATTPTPADHAPSEAAAPPPLSAAWWKWTFIPDNQPLLVIRVFTLWWRPNCRVICHYIVMESPNQKSLERDSLPPRTDASWILRAIRDTLKITGCFNLPLHARPLCAASLFMFLFFSFSFFQNWRICASTPINLVGEKWKSANVGRRAAPPPLRSTPLIKQTNTTGWGTLMRKATAGGRQSAHMKTLWRTNLRASLQFLLQDAH